MIFPTSQAISEILIETTRILYDLFANDTRFFQTQSYGYRQTLLTRDQGPLLLTWFNFNPSKDK